MARERRPIPCAVESRDRRESLHGTASRVRRWLLVEQPGPWGRDALTESRLDPVVARTIASHSRRHGVRVLLIRRPAWRSAEDGRKVYLARSDPERSWIEELDLDGENELLHLDLAVLARSEPPGVGTAGPALHLVCTNGRHDQCCANFGRPVVRALDDFGVPDVWESSHVGGDRFAANLVYLPWGLYFGRVGPDEAPQLLADLAMGLLDLDRFRGRSCFPPLVQAAEYFVRRELGERRFGALELVRASADTDEDMAVVFALPEGGQVEAHVRRVRGAVQHLTCSGGGLSRPWSYELVDLHPHRRGAAHS